MFVLFYLNTNVSSNETAVPAVALSSFQFDPPDLDQKIGIIFFFPRCRFYMSASFKTVLKFLGTCPKDFLKAFPESIMTEGSGQVQSHMYSHLQEASFKLTELHSVYDCFCLIAFRLLT